MAYRKTAAAARHREATRQRTRERNRYLPDLAADYGYDGSKHLLPKAELEAAVLAWQGGDKEALERAIMGMLPLVQRQVNRVLKDSTPNHARDLFQHVLYKLPAALKRWKPDRSPLLVHIATVADQRARFHLRSVLESTVAARIPEGAFKKPGHEAVMRATRTLKCHDENGEMDEDIPAKERAYPRPEPGELDHVKVLVRALPEPGRKILTQRYGGKSVMEVAEKLGKTRLWVRQQENEAMRRLRAMAMRESK